MHDQLEQQGLATASQSAAEPTILRSADKKECGEDRRKGHEEPGLIGHQLPQPSNPLTSRFIPYK